MGAIDDLRLRASIIKKEEQEGKNTALRVGGLLYDTIDYIDSISGGTPTPSEKTEVVVSPLYQQGTQIARIRVDNLTSTLWAPSAGPVPDPYDDTEIRELISDLDDDLDTTKTRINSESARLSELIRDIDSMIYQKINDTVNQADWIKNNFPEFKITWQSGWDDKIEAYLQRVGVWGRSNGVTKTQWSELIQKVDSFEYSVNMVIEDVNNQIDVLSGGVSTKIDAGLRSITNTMEATYSKKTAENVIEWMYSAFKNSAVPERTFNQIVSAGKTGEEGLISAVSEIRTEVTKLQNGEYLASSSLAVQVDSPLDKAIAGLYALARPGEATTSLFTQVKNNTNNVQTAITQSSDAYQAVMDLRTDYNNFSAQVITKATLDSAVAGLVAKTDYNAAKIVAMVNNSGSEVKIEADKINLKGVTRIYNKNLNLPVIVAGTEGISIGTFNEDGTPISQTPWLDITEATITAQSNQAKTLEGFKLGKGSLDLWQPLAYGSGYANHLMLSPTEIKMTREGGQSHPIPLEVKTDSYGTVSLKCPAGLNVNANVDLIEPVVNMTASVTSFKASGFELLTSGKTEINQRKSGELLDIKSAGDIKIQNSTSSSNVQIKSTKILELTAENMINLTARGILLAPTEGLKSTMELEVVSDEKLKNIHAVLNPDIESIANARIIDYTLKESKSTEKRLGSVAQDWQEIFPNAVREGEDGYLGMDYASIALASAVTAAREIVKLKKENEELKARLERLESIVLKNQ